VNKFHWLGDSWLYGYELEKTPGILQHQTKNFSFPKIVSDYFDAKCINLSLPGISNDLLPLIAWENLKNIDSQNDTVFFCLTSPSRVSLFNEQSEPRTVLPSIQDTYRRPSEHPNWKEWYKYFDTAPQQTFNYERNINFLFNWCKNQQLNFYFMNIFTVQTYQIFDQTLSENWLLPKNKCLANCILPVLDSEFGGIVLEDRSWLTNIEWQNQQKAIDQYIKPNYCHPNLLGHKKIAQEIIKLLEQKPKL
jgi:hypothetical protein